jgi:hypothetical protein
LTFILLQHGRRRHAPASQSAPKTAELGGCRFTGRCLWAGWRRAAYTNVDAARRMRGGFSASLRPRVHTVQDAPLHHPRCSSVAVHRHLGARGISCTELHRAPRCRQTSLHWHRRCERPAPSPGTGGAGLHMRGACCTSSGVNQRLVDSNDALLPHLIVIYLNALNP